MSSILRRIRQYFFLLLLVLPSTLFATNGYWSSGYGPKSKGLAGACVAMAFGAMCAASNPAALAVIGNRLEFGGALFLPTRGFTANADASPIGPPQGPASIPAGEYESDNSWFIIPHFAYNHTLDEKSSLGVTFGGNGGMNTEYDSAIFANFANPMDPRTLPSSKTGIDLMQAFLGLTYAFRLTPQHAIGITSIFAAQSFQAQGLQPFSAFSRHPDKVTDNGRDISYGGGLRIGWLGKLTDRFNLGVSYQSKLWMSRFKDYAGLFAEDGDFDIPPNYDLGFSYKISPSFTFAFDYQKIQFSKVKAISNSSDLVFMPGTTLLGTEEGLGFGWKDMDIYKFGWEWEYSPQWTFRAGYSQANDAFPNTQALFNTLAPATVKQHYTLGFSRKFDPTHELSVALTHSPNAVIHGQNPNTGPQTGSVEMHQWDLEIGWSIRF